MLRSHRGWLVAVCFTLLGGCAGAQGNAASGTDGATDTLATTSSATEPTTDPGSSSDTTTSSSTTSTASMSDPTAASLSSNGSSGGSSTTLVEQTDTSPTASDTESSTTTGDEATTLLLTVDAALAPPALVALSLATGVGTTVCGLGPSFVIDTMEFSATNMLLVHDSSVNRLLRVDPCDCGFQVVGLSDVDNLEFTRDENGNLLGAVPGLSAFATVDEQTGVANIQGPLGIDFVDGAVTWSQAESRLLILEATTNQLFRFDPVTMTIGNPTTVVPDITNPGLTTVAQDGAAYLCADAMLYELDTMTGTATAIGLTGMTGPCTVLAAPRSALGCF